MKITELNNTCARIGAFPRTFFSDRDNSAIILIHKTKKKTSKSLNVIKTIQTKRFNHRTFIFFKRKKNPHSQVKTVREEAIIVGQCEKQEPLNTAAEGYIRAKKLFLQRQQKI